MSDRPPRGPYITDWIGLGWGAVAMLGHAFGWVDTLEGIYLLVLGCFLFLLGERRDSE